MPIYQCKILTSLMNFAFLVLLITLPQITLAATPADKVKTAVIYNITQFVTWPQKTLNLTICILGEGSINNELGKINRKNSRGRRLSITNRSPNAPFEQLCDAVFIHSTDSQTVNKVLDRLKGKPVLTISDHRSFNEMGGMIELFRDSKRINFSINNSSATAADLSISSKLLKLAKSVK